MTGGIENLFNDLPRDAATEKFDELFSGRSFRLVRIVSNGQTTPPGDWYDQDEDEWVIVLQGAAKLRFDDDDADVDMHPGDYIHIPAHRRHRVTFTAPDTVWLALHFEA